MRSASMSKKLLRYKLLNLHSLIVLLAFLVAAVTAVNGFYATHNAQRDKLIQETLSSNHAYAKKLATSTDNFIRSAHQQLAFAAHLIEQNFNDRALMLREAERVQQQTENFNSVAIVNHEAVVLATSSSVTSAIGKKVTTSGVLESIEAQEFWVSLPYMSVAGNLVALITYPMFNENGDYLGYVGGTIYLKERSVLNDLLGEHFHQDGSYIYVVDRNKQIIYHPDVNRVGTYTTGNMASNTVLYKHSGSIQSVNSLGIEMLAGFATIESAQWGVVVQRPLKDTIASLDSLMVQVILRMLPLGIITTIAILILATYLARPLHKLARSAGKMDNPAAYNEITKISSWYAESYILKQAILKGLTLLNVQINRLQRDADTDPLTGAYNRRGLQLLLDELTHNKIPFSILAVDIDHFKKVNDTYGHDAGDKVLIMLANVMREVSREPDIVARTGGEEFLLVLPNSPEDVALKIAERLRIRVSEIVTEPVGSVTISIGITTCSKHRRSMDEVLKGADKALYRAKELGRNRCEVFGADA